MIIFDAPICLAMSRWINPIGPQPIIVTVPPGFSLHVSREYRAQANGSTMAAIAGSMELSRGSR